MLACWRCHLAVQDGSTTCTSCGAPAVRPSGPESSSLPAGNRPEATPLGPRIKFVLEAIPPPDAPKAPVVAPEPKRVESRSEYVRRLAAALRENTQASLLLSLILAFVVFSALRATAPPETGRFNAASMQEAAQTKLLIRPATPSFSTLTVAGATIQVDEAWIAQVGRYEEYVASREIVPDTDGFNRLYLLLRITGAESVRLFAGNPPEPLKTLTVDRGGKPTVLHYLDISTFDLQPQTLLIADPTRPKAGSAKLVIR